MSPPLLAVLGAIMLLVGFSIGGSHGLGALIVALGWAFLIVGIWITVVEALPSKRTRRDPR